MKKEKLLRGEKISQLRFNVKNEKWMKKLHDISVTLSDYISRFPACMSARRLKYRLMEQSDA